MCAWRWPVTILLGIVARPATPSPVSPPTLAPPPLSRLALPLPPTSPPWPGSERVEPSPGGRCPLKISASSLAVRFGGSFTANCSVQNMAFSALGWEVSLEPPVATTERFLVWRVNRVTEWHIDAMCFALSEQGGQCHASLPLTVYKLPDHVSVEFANHTGPLLDAQRYTLRCAVRGVAPVQSLLVTFYRGGKALGSRRSAQRGTRERPTTEAFTLGVVARREDDRAQYWCEAELQLEAVGEPRPLVVSSPKLTATVLFGPQLDCPAKLQVHEGETFSCEVSGNPKPSVTWFRDGQAVAVPAHSSRGHAGTYTVLAVGPRIQKNFTVEVEVMPRSGTNERSRRPSLLAALLLLLLNGL